MTLVLVLVVSPTTMVTTSLLYPTYYLTAIRATLAATPTVTPFAAEGLPPTIKARRSMSLLPIDARGVQSWILTSPPPPSASSPTSTAVYSESPGPGPNSPRYHFFYRSFRYPFADNSLYSPSCMALEVICSARFACNSVRINAIPFCYRNFILLAQFVAP